MSQTEERFKHTPQDLIIPSFEISRAMRGNQRWYTISDTKQTRSYPSITTVLGSGEKPWLDNWRKMLGEKKAKTETERCSQRGSAVHDLAEQYLKNNNIANQHEKQHVKLFNQIRPFLNKIDNILTQEEFLFSDTFKVAGQVDCIGHYDGELAIIDFKTSNGTKTREMITDYFLQCTAYSIMFYEMYGIAIDKIVIIMAVERNFIPLIFKEVTEPHGTPLLEKINTFYQTIGKSK